MSTNKDASPILRIYRKTSRSIWNDSSTVLLLANIVRVKKHQIDLGYEHYIYLHKGHDSSNFGISVSKQLVLDNPSFDKRLINRRYLEGKDMLAFLLLYIEEICDFTSYFKNDFEAVFMMCPKSYFAAAEKHWRNIIEKM